MSAAVRHVRDRVLDACYVLLSTLPWLPAAMQRAADRRRDEQAARTERRVGALEDRERLRARPPKPGERLRRIRQRQAEDSTDWYTTVDSRRGGRH